MLTYILGIKLSHVMGAEVSVKQSVDYKIKPGQWVLK